MSVSISPRPPTADAPARAEAKETIWRLAAAAFGHPTPEMHAALQTGAFHDALAGPWRAVTGRDWRRCAPSPDFATLEAGFIEAFLHGPGGKPVAPLLAGDYEALLAGHSRPVFMLNIAAFYRHFGLRAAAGDEGRSDEPDHLASQLEFVTVLAHLEARALRRGSDPAPLRRAQRDFLRRYLGPLLNALAARMRGRVEGLDPTLRQLVEELPALAETEAAALEARVGAYRDRERPAYAGVGTGSGARTLDQSLWG